MCRYSDTMGDPHNPGTYSGVDVHPLELIFFKTNRFAPYAHATMLVAIAINSPSKQ